MKRHPDLQKFSSDHHQGLVHARRLRHTASGDEPGPIQDTARELLDFWREETSVHFRAEEDVLLPVAVCHGLEPNSEPVVRMIVQHTRIRGLVVRLEDELAIGLPNPETLRKLGETLEAHIRLEEREVFPLLESELPDHALAEMTSRLGA